MLFFIFLNVNLTIYINIERIYIQDKLLNNNIIEKVNRLYQKSLKDCDCK